jgi:hypothetical protein
LPNPNFFKEITFVVKSKSKMTAITATNPIRDDEPFALASAVESVSVESKGETERGRPKNE